MSDGDRVVHEERPGGGVFVLYRGPQRVGELTYVRRDAHVVIVDHAEVSSALRGQNLGRLLVDAVVAWARSTGTSIVPVCPYVRLVFDRDASLADVRA